LKLKYDELLSNVAFNCKLRHYSEEAEAERALMHSQREKVLAAGAVQLDPASTPLGFSA